MNRHHADVAEQQFALAVATTTNAMRADPSASVEDVASDALFEAARDSWVYFTNEQPLDIRQLGTVAQVIEAVDRDMAEAAYTLAEYQDDQRRDALLMQQVAA